MIENDTEKSFRLPRPLPYRAFGPRKPGDCTVPPEAWDREHPDHNWWVNGRGWCYDAACADRTFGRPEKEPSETAPLRMPTYDGSLWGPDVCRCSDHVDPHRHTEADPRGKSIYDDEEEGQ